MAEQQKAFNPDQAAMDAVSSIQAIMALGALSAQKSAQIQDVIVDTIRAALSHAEGEAGWRSGYPQYDGDGGVCHIPLSGYPDFMVVAFNCDGNLIDSCGDDVGYSLEDVERWHPIGTHPAPQVAVPEGYALVPVDPNEEMLDAWFTAPRGDSGSVQDFTTAYRAMLASAPAAPAGESADKRAQRAWKRFQSMLHPDDPAAAQKPVSDPDDPTIEDYQSLCAALYQACGAYDMPGRIMDVLSKAQPDAEPFRHLLDGLLPVCAPDEQKDAEEVHGRPEVFEALFNFSHDSTSDNAINVVQTIMQAARAAAPEEREIAALEDAERYRWLRDEDNWGCDNPSGDADESLWGELGELHGAAFDEFVDRLRAGKEGEPS